MPSQDRQELIEKYGESFFAADGDAVTKAQNGPQKSAGETARNDGNKKRSSHHKSGSHHHHSSSHKHGSHNSGSHNSGSHNSGSHNSGSHKHGSRKNHSNKNKSRVKKLVRSGKYRFLSLFNKKIKPISPQTEKKLRKFSIIASIVIIIAIIAAFVVIALNDMEEEEQHNQNRSQYQSDQTVEQLTAEKVKYESELSMVKQEYKENTTTMGRAIIIAVDPTSSLLESMSARMDQYKYDGVIALSSAYFRDSSKYASIDEINDLERNGWDVAIVIDSELEFKSVYNKCISVGLGIPKAVYARNARLTDTLCDKIEEKKISLVFCSPNNDMPDRDLIYVTALPYNDSTTKAIFLSYNEEGKNLGCIVSNETAGAVYIDVTFGRMLAVFDAQKKGDEVAVTTASAEIYRVKDYSKQNENQDQSYEAQISSIEARIKQIDELIIQKQNEYYNSRN